MSRVLICALLLGSLLPAVDEIDALVAELQPPARFAAHQPAFTIEEFEREFVSDEGTWKWGFFGIKDGDRWIAYVPKHGFHGGSIYLLTHDPEQAPTELPLPSERFHIDTAPGASFRTDHFLPDENGGKNWGYKDQSGWQVAEDGSRVTLVRRFAGSHAFAKWEHNTKKKEQRVDHVGTFVLRCDPVFGYLIEGEWRTGLDFPETGQYVSVYPPDMSNPWVTEGIHQRVAITPADRPGWIGHANNHPCIDWCDNSKGSWRLKDGGVAAYLEPVQGWSWAGTIVGGEASLSVCNVHADQDLLVRWPGDLAKAENGLIYHTVRSRLVRLPPELTQAVWDDMELLFADRQMVVIPVGSLATFEDQPLSTGEARIGMTFGNGGFPEIVAGAGRDGSKAMRVHGTVWPNLPQVVLKANHRFRIEGWYRVEPATPGDLATLQAQHEKNQAKRLANWEKAVKKAEKKGEAPPPEPEPQAWSEPGPATAHITAHYYRWTPHNHGDRLLEQITSQTDPDGPEWQRVELEFTAPAWGPFVDIRFVCSNGGTAFLDDFQIVDLGPAP